jgi:hypothetical protein
MTWCICFNARSASADQCRISDLCQHHNITRACAWYMDTHVILKQKSLHHILPILLHMQGRQGYLHLTLEVCDSSHYANCHLDSCHWTRAFQPICQYRLQNTNCNSRRPCGHEVSANQRDHMWHGSKLVHRGFQHPGTAEFSTVRLNVGYSISLSHTRHAVQPWVCSIASARQPVLCSIASALGPRCARCGTSTCNRHTGLCHHIIACPTSLVPLVQSSRCVHLHLRVDGM